MSLTEFCLRLFCALVAGLIIGFERQWQHKSAGIRTIALVSVGSALYVMLSLLLTEEKGDVTRIVGQVVSGIGFLGAGIIFKEGLTVHGLSTAATVWCSSAIGCITAAGYFKEAFFGTMAILTVNLLLIPIDRWLSTKNGN
jgi:putative Mg2+ transporter-C (MgtC) family protein